ncbi:DNA topoisomerase IV subunit A [Sphingomicrobium astaxanthinifaciens]|uniref:DNA topoisomerase IV subunit A n=1 Tax=Sphingomicrobium astaxanthinifaciens TaxID=1227949 RepID=UPI001FCA8AE8|nr:DNA topoisomerase IV subunit A [Sphingomicrobium astaxanthinifaciens]MCJ7420573.1 DNA topoisomerase IV subunit A [Sphingomicrobium astaxanthinifaciens]
MTTESVPDQIIDEPFSSALSERYLVYALSTITARSLPDVRDGLKPVHRRLLWAMRKLKLDPTGAYKKSARVVGDVIGKYHPHGDASVYDAMVRLAQDFSLRYPLVEGQGNFGNIDGDNAAAYRYTEARLTRTAIRLMAGIDEGTVPFRSTYNGEEDEPEVFPGLFPNLLANGAAGIAVGMATSIPPHNVGELCDAAVHLVGTRDARDETLMKYVKGPDFPTGGVLVDDEGVILKAYVTGRGSFRIRAKVTREDLKGGAWQLVVTEIPYGVAKGKLIEQIAGLIGDKKLPILADVRDESAEDIRIVLEPRSRTVDAALLEESLYKLSDLESRFSLNLNVLEHGRTPGVMSLREALLSWIDFQYDVMRNRAQWRIGKIDDRLELVRGYLIAFLNLDRVIEIIRTEDEPKAVMMAEFELTDRQAEAILNMRLRSLRKLEEMELKGEEESLLAEKSELEALLANENGEQEKALKDALRALKKEYKDDPRRTAVRPAAVTADVDWTQMIDKEPVTVILSKKGWIRAMKGHVDLSTVPDMKFREGDEADHAFHAQTTDRILVVAENGRIFTVGADKLPGGRGFGEPLKLMIDLEGEGEIVTALPLDPKARYLVAASDGRGFVALGENLSTETRKGKQLVNLRKGAKVRLLKPLAPEDDAVAVVGENRKLLVFSLEELPELARGAGVQLQRYRDGGLGDAIGLRLADGLSWAMGGGTRNRTEPDMTPWKVARGAAGRMAPQGFPQSNRFVPPVRKEDEAAG